MCRARAGPADAGGIRGDVLQQRGLRVAPELPVLRAPAGHLQGVLLQRGGTRRGVRPCGGANSTEMTNSRVDVTFKIHVAASVQETSAEFCKMSTEFL